MDGLIIDSNEQLASKGIKTFIGGFFLKKPIAQISSQLKEKSMDV